MEVKVYARKLLETVLAEMNTVMGFDPILQAPAGDADLLALIRVEARGQGDVKNAVRANDFVKDAPDEEKEVFSKIVHDFFVEVGVWDDETMTPIMVDAEPKAAAPVKKRSSKKEGVEAQVQPEMEIGEGSSPEQSQQLVAGTPEPAAAASIKKKGKAAPAAPAGQAPAGQAPEAKKEGTMKSAAAKKGAAKTKTAKSRGTATQKKAATARVQTPRGTGVGALTRELIAKHPDKGNTEIAEMVRAKLKTETPAASVAWYRNQMKHAKKAKKK